MHSHGVQGRVGKWLVCHCGATFRTLRELVDHIHGSEEDTPTVPAWLASDHFED